MKQITTIFLLLVPLLVACMAHSTNRALVDSTSVTTDIGAQAFAPVDSVTMLTRPEIAEVQHLVVRLRCVTCHIETEPTGPGDTDMFAPTFVRLSRSMDAGKVAEFSAFMLDPQKAHPGVNMPSFWGTPAAGQITSVKEKLLITPQSQTDAIARYIYLMTRVREKQD
jgi:hypothetical protein